MRNWFSLWRNVRQHLAQHWRGYALPALGLCLCGVAAVSSMRECSGGWVPVSERAFTGPVPGLERLAWATPVPGQSRF